MELVSSERFLAWAKSHDIVPDERYEEPRCLVFVPYRDFDRFWLNPNGGSVARRFMERMLRGPRAWSGGYLWPRGGQPLRWVIPDAATRRAGIPDDFAGAVRYRASELDDLSTLLLSQMAILWQTGDDLFVVPQHAQQIIWLDHHEVVHVSFAEQRLVEPFIAEMAKAGFRLPTALPDPTFKRPGWMQDTAQVHFD